MPRIHLKYIDDMTIAESINLKQKLIPNPNLNPTRPLQYHERTLQILPEGISEVQAVLDQLTAYSQEHQMKINCKKTKAILFNSSRNNDFLPKLTIENNQELEVVV